MSGKNRNRFESLLGVWTNQYIYKTSWVSLPAKQAITDSRLFLVCVLTGVILIFQNLCQSQEGYCGFNDRDDRMGEKIKTHKKSLDQNLTPQISHSEFLSHKNLFAELHGWDM